VLSLVSHNGGLHTLTKDEKKDDVIRKRDVNVHSEWRRMLNGYSRYVRPNFTGTPTLVSLEVTVLSFGELNERDMTFTINFFLRQRWYDYRLRHNLSATFTPLLGRTNPADIIWVPDTVFINAMKSTKQQVTNNHDKLDIKSNGEVLWGQRVTTIYSCAMKFHNYPMDIQHCGIGMQSYAYTDRHLIYQWRKYPNSSEKPVYLLNDHLPQFHVVKTSYHHQMMSYALGNYSVLYYNFVFKRKLSVSLIQIFFPTISIVGVSWSSFFFHKNCVSPRVSFGTTTMFTLSFLWGKVNRGLPKVSYIKAIDTYFMVSFTFIMLSLLEYATLINSDSQSKKEKTKDRALSVNSRRMLPLEKRIPIFKNMSKKDCDIYSISGRLTIRRHKEIQEAEKSIQLVDLNNRGKVSSIVYSTEEELTKEKVIKPHISRNDTNQHLIPSRLDIASRFMFPISFLAFNLFFWNYYSDDTI